MGHSNLLDKPGQGMGAFILATISVLVNLYFFHLHPHWPLHLCYKIALIAPNTNTINTQFDSSGKKRTWKLCGLGYYKQTPVRALYVLEKLKVFSYLSG